jgi:acetolactate synthase-1/2/3 large subunit
VLGGASKLLIEMTRMLGYPITQTLMGLGAYPGSDRQFIGMLGMHGAYEANMAMHNADAILAIGARFDDRVTNNVEKFCPDAQIAHIDVDPSSISKTVQVDIPIVGPVDSVLTEMIALIKESEVQPDKENLSDWWAQIDEWRKRHGGRYLTNEKGLMKPQQVIECLQKLTAGDAYITTDVGQHQMFAAQYLRFEQPNRWITSGGLGTMGFGFPAAMGVQLSFPDETVVCITGEGSIQMNIQELSTCMQYNIPVKILNINNQSLGMVRQWQDMNYESRHSHSYMESLPDFIKLAEAYGHVGMKIEKAEDLEPMMKKALAMKDKLVFIDVYVDPSEHVYPMQVPAASMRDMWLSKTERT